MINSIRDTFADLLRQLQLDRESLGMSTLARWAPVLALLVLVLVSLFTAPNFLGAANLRSIFVQSSILIILAVGQTFVISTAGIDLSVSSVIQLSAVSMGAVVTMGGSVELGMLVAVAVGACAGLINGLIVAKGKITDFVVTLGTFGAFSGLALLISDAKAKTIIAPIMIEISTGGFGIVSYMVLIAIIIAFIARTILFQTAFGTHVLAVGGNRFAAEAMGLSTTGVKVGVYTIAGTLAGVAAVLLTARIGAAEPTGGSEYQLTSIAAAVLGGVSLFGGRSNIIGPIIGAIVLTGVVSLLTITKVPPYYQPIAVGAVVILSAFLRRFER